MGREGFEPSWLGTSGCPDVAREWSQQRPVVGFFTTCLELRQHNGLCASPGAPWDVSIQLVRRLPTRPDQRQVDARSATGDLPVSAGPSAP